MKYVESYQTMKQLLLLFCSIAMLLGCSSDEEEEREGLFQRTVLIYISGENNLSSYLRDEIAQMKTGSKGIGNNALVIYVDDNNAQQLPYVARLKEGKTVDSVALFHEDVLSSDPKNMAQVLQYVSTHYPANDYGLVLWGHATGWFMEDSVVYAASRRKAYGIDDGKNNPNNTNYRRWMNMYSLAKTLEAWQQPLHFIFADCCHFQCIESAYELRNVTNYLIGSPAEIPGDGAPYHTLTKHLFDTTDEFYKSIADTYFSQTINGYHVPLSVISTKHIEQLAWATGKALSSLGWTGDGCPDLRGLIHYNGKEKNEVMYDMNAIMQEYLPEVSEEAYKEWRMAFDSVVVYKKYASRWMTNQLIDFNSFQMSEEAYGGVSMFVPQRRTTPSNYAKYNNMIEKTSWYWAARLNELGW